MNPSPANQPDHDGQLAHAEGLTAQGHEADNLLAEIETGLDVLRNADLIVEDQVNREFGTI